MNAQTNVATSGRPVLVTSNERKSCVSCRGRCISWDEQGALFLVYIPEHNTFHDSLCPSSKYLGARSSSDAGKENSRGAELDGPILTSSRIFVFDLDFSLRGARWPDSHFVSVLLHGVLRRRFLVALME